MLPLIKLILMVTLVKNSLLKHLTNFITFLTFLYGSQFSFMNVLNVKRINLFLLNPKIFLLLYHFMEMLLILIPEFQWRLKAPFLLLLIITHIVLLSLMLSATLLLLTQLLTLPLNMQFKLFFIIGLQNLDPHNFSLLTEVLNIQTKIWPIYALFSILITHLVLLTPWTNGLVEFQNRNLGTHLRLFYKTLLPTCHFKLKFMLTPIILLLSLNLNSPLIRLFSIPILAFLQPSLLTYLVTPPTTV